MNCPKCFENKSVRLIMRVIQTPPQFECFSCGFRVSIPKDNPFYPVPKVPPVTGRHYDYIILDDLVGQNIKMHVGNRTATAAYAQAWNVKFNPSIRGEMKEIHTRKLYNDTIIELRFITQFKTGWFAANVKPIVDAMKGFIPSTSREYDPVTKLWYIGVEYWNPLEIMLKGMGWTIVDKTGQTATPNGPKVNVPKDYEENFYYKQQPVVQAVDAKSIAQQLSQYLGVEITSQDIKTLKTLYRAKARELHPDLGGDAQKMSELNRLWSLYTAGGNVQ